MPETTRELKLGVYGISIVDGRVLVIKKARGPYRGQYDLPGGGIEFGESIREGLSRELEEEAGVKLLTTDLFDVNDVYNTFEHEGTTYESHHVGIYYLIEVAGELKTTGDELDSAGALCVAVAELTEGNTSKIALPVIRKAAGLS